LQSKIIKNTISLSLLCLMFFFKSLTYTFITNFLKSFRRGLSCWDNRPRTCKLCDDYSISTCGLSGVLNSTLLCNLIRLFNKSRLGPDTSYSLCCTTFNRRVLPSNCRAKRGRIYRSMFVSSLLEVKHHLRLLR
jgi:hypothetical protein